MHLGKPKTIRRANNRKIHHVEDNKVPGMTRATPNFEQLIVEVQGLDLQYSGVDITTLCATSLKNYPYTLVLEWHWTTWKRRWRSDAYQYLDYSSHIRSKTNWAQKDHDLGKLMPESESSRRPSPDESLGFYTSYEIQKPPSKTAMIILTCKQQWLFKACVSYKTLQTHKSATRKSTMTKYGARVHS